MGFFDMLAGYSPGITAASKGLAAYQQGRLAAQERNQDSAMTMYELMRQARTDKQMEAYRQQQIASMASAQRVRELTEKSNEHSYNTGRAENPDDPDFAEFDPGRLYGDLVTAKRRDRLQGVKDETENRRQYNNIVSLFSKDPRAAAVIAEGYQKDKKYSELFDYLKTPVAQHNPVMGSAEWLSAQDAAARIRAKYRQPAAGAPGGPAKPPTEFAQKTALVVPRAQEALETLNTFYEKGAPLKSTASKIPLVGSYFMSDEEQQLVGAAEALATAILRPESGAAVPDSEVERYARQFIPLPGEGYEARQKKKKRAEMAVDAMLRAADPALVYQQKQGLDVPVHAPRAGETRTPLTVPRVQSESTGFGSRKVRSPEQQAWDEAVAKYGEKAVVESYGPRPKQ